MFYDFMDAILESCRYCDELGTALKEVRASKLLFLSYTSDYQGSVDVSALLEDGRVFSYEYSYGSCSGCDSWEAEELTYDAIVQEMVKNGTYFDSIGSWTAWMNTRRGWNDDEPIMKLNVAEARLGEIADRVLGEL